MTQNDLNNGRLICLIGVAPAKPAQYVIFRVAQQTADSRVGGSIHARRGCRCRRAAAILL
jgi:hypothetical protein